MDKDKVNVYQREKLYEEVWNAPVTQVAKLYGVSNVAIKKICKSMNIPTPPNGYWTKLKFGKETNKEPLTAMKGSNFRYGIDPNKSKSKNNTVTPLTFLSLEEQEQIYSIASVLEIDSNKKFCKEILNHHNIVNEWNKKYPSILGLSYRYSEYKLRRSYDNRKRIEVPVLAGVVSKDSLMRIYRILNCINNAINQLGYFMNDDLSFSIRGERVEIIFYERQESYKHVITSEEKQKLKQYEYQIKRYGYGGEPYIPTTDFRFNGNLVFTTKKYTFIKDTDKICIEDRLADMLIQLVQQSEVVRKERLQKEEEQLRKEEEKRQRDLPIIMHNAEVDQLTDLLLEAQDYEIAEKIRKYVSKVQQNDTNHEKADWIEWASAKANWYDPTINKTDNIFGKRELSLDAIPKKKEFKYWW